MLIQPLGRVLGQDESLSIPASEQDPTVLIKWMQLLYDRVEAESGVRSRRISPVCLCRCDGLPVGAAGYSGRNFDERAVARIAGYASARL